jgi:K+-sensing histidine kinase KdpD
MTIDSRRIDELYESLNHELRGPLSPLAIGIEILKIQGVSGPCAAETLAMMERQMQLIKRTLDELLEARRAV